MVTVRSQGVSAGLERDVEELGIIKIQSDFEASKVARPRACTCRDIIVF